MKILILGDVMGVSGRNALYEKLPDLIKKKEIDFVIVNGENAADDGRGITQDIAKKYKAECTPEFYLFNQNRKLVYRGRMDETSPGSNTAPSAKDLRVAIKSLLMNQPISDEQFPSMGCNIKWKVS